MAKEIFSVAGVMWVLTLTGLTVGFGLLKIQGEQCKKLCLNNRNEFAGNYMVLNRVSNHFNYLDNGP